MSTPFDTYTTLTAALLNLPIDPAYRPGVIANLERTEAIAQLVMEFPLPEDLEPAPIFVP
ncbi:MAG: DUF4089 domain-containing protein [Synechococcales cyanobacterium T60_A2020_003]|nr:DUF4089 domain-containing protein [Synechococcales cyanobacterium T60_A2020_003]